MKKNTKIIQTLIISLALTFTSIVGVNAEWKQSSKGWWYNQGNSYAVGWKCINGKWYNFNNIGYMRTGWIQDGTESYYLGNDGVMKTGFQVINGVTYKFDNNGKYIGKFVGAGQNISNGKQTRVFEWKNGDIYDGEWVNNVIEGNGKITYKNGNVYEGSFKNGVRNGNGIFKWKNGDIYDGEWNLDKMNGQGKYTFSGGKIINGIWEDNNCIERN